MTESERLLTDLNNSVFFKEFTYAQNELRHPAGDTKELADNVVWLDDLLIVYQVKGRDASAVQDVNTEENWFEKKVNVLAKKQIRDTISFFDTYNSLPVVNERGQQIDIIEAGVNHLVKIIIYDPKSELLAHKRQIKFLESRSAGLIHLFQIKDYSLICKKLVTPSELAEYLDFREEMYLIHKDEVSKRQEKYLLGHFFTTPDTQKIEDSFIDNVEKVGDLKSSDVSWILNNFFEKVVMHSGGRDTDYHYIIKEIAKLNREELKAFNERYHSTIEQVRNDKSEFPLRFTSSKTGCGFVFIGLDKQKSQYWENALFNFTEIYKYKHKLLTCIGVVVFKDGVYFQIYWAYNTGPWQYNRELDEALTNEEMFYKGSEIQILPRYPLAP
jgi:hypothetical protein